MSIKFVWRTFRNVVTRERPYFAHLALTHRCNLRCRFCHIQDSKFDELATAGMKRVIDRLDEIGVGVVSISGGGEPLLREDCIEIADYAAARGMYTKLTSNGTMPRRRYQELLGSRVKEIGISLDGVEGNDLPFSHTAPQILNSLRYLHDELPPGKQLTINVTVSDANRVHVQEIVTFCAREYPRAKVWLNPVMTGDGALRTHTGGSPEPSYLRTCKSPNLLSARFYAEGVEQQSRTRIFDWDCLAGSMFFDIKPNGDFWLCQDLPSKTHLNVLQPDFLERLRTMDVSQRRGCSGCTYSCYYVTQNGLEPRNWPDMAGLWWQSNTIEGDRFRTAASRWGWGAGLAVYALGQMGLRLKPVLRSVASILFCVSLLSASDPSDILSCMERAGERNQETLEAYTSQRVYTAANPRLNKSATMTVEVTYTPPGEKQYRIVDRSGSGSIRGRVLEPILEAECRNAAPEVRAETSIDRRNYGFEFAGFDSERGDAVFHVAPTTRRQHLFKGKIWVDVESCAIRRIEGSPAVSPSFWVRQTDFRHDYAQFGDVWLPVRHHTESKLLLFGRSILDIEYLGYSFGPRTSALLGSATVP